MSWFSAFRSVSWEYGPKCLSTGISWRAAIATASAPPISPASTGDSPKDSIARPHVGTRTTLRSGAWTPS